MDRRGVRHEGDIARDSGGSDYAGRSVCEFADSRGAFEVWREHGRDGGVYYRLESLGAQQVADGSRYTRVEICFCEAFERFNTSAYSRDLGAFYQQGFEIKFENEVVFAVMTYLVAQST